MKMVVLDGYTLNPADLSWELLRAIGELLVYDRISPVDVVTRAAAAEILLSNKVLLSRGALNQLLALRFIAERPSMWFQPNRPDWRIPC